MSALGVGIYSTVTELYIPTPMGKVAPRKARVVFTNDFIQLVDYGEDASVEGLMLLLSSQGVKRGEGVKQGDRYELSPCFDLDEMQRRNLTLLSTSN